MSRDDRHDGHASLEGVRNQLLDYETQIKEYLDNLEAKVDTYKFSVEKQPDGLSIDLALKATVHVKPAHK
ncbi:MAG TPA: hypothetical protein VFE91_02680 [Nitrososphaerales archaeon]|nr:hypothetical protein [Nitrososphaerales archaeon]